MGKIRAPPTPPLTYKVGVPGPLLSVDTQTDKLRLEEEQKKEETMNLKMLIAAGKMEKNKALQINLKLDLSIILSPSMCIQQIKPFDI